MSTSAEGNGKKKILIVEDEPDVVAYLEMLLRDAGYVTVSARDGLEPASAIARNAAFITRSAGRTISWASGSIAARHSFHIRARRHMRPTASSSRRSSRRPSSVMRNTRLPSCASATIRPSSSSCWRVG